MRLSRFLSYVSEQVGPQSLNACVCFVIIGEQHDREFDVMQSRMQRHAALKASNETQISRSLRRLEEVGLIERYKQPGEKLCWYLRLTYKGKEVWESYSSLN